MPKKIIETQTEITLETETEMKHGGARPGAGRPKSETKKKVVSVTLTDLEIDLLDEIARRNGVSKSVAVGLMINETYGRMVN